MGERYDPRAEIERNGASDVPMKRHGLRVSASEYPHGKHGAAQAQPKMPDKMPWSAMVDVVPPEAQDANKGNMDSMPIQYELHSNTKFHQLGGIYESYSSSKS